MANFAFIIFDSPSKGRLHFVWRALFSLVCPFVLHVPLFLALIFNGKDFYIEASYGLLYIHRALKRNILIF